MTNIYNHKRHKHSFKSDPNNIKTSFNNDEIFHKNFKTNGTGGDREGSYKQVGQMMNAE